MKPSFYRCEDTDECLQVPNPCGANGGCINLVGSYKCTSCTPNCGENAVCKVTNSDMEESECICNSGFEQDKEASTKADMFICKDVNECLNADMGVFKNMHDKNVKLFSFILMFLTFAFFSCNGVGQNCVNELGGYRCGCEDGYQKHPDPKSNVCILAQCQPGYKLEITKTNTTEIRTEVWLQFTIGIKESFFKNSYNTL